MILEVFSSKTRERLELIKTCKFAQYTDEFCGYGTFSITVPMSDDSITYLVKDNFILFDDGVMGIIKYRYKVTDEEESTIEIKGFIVDRILYTRCFLTTKVFTGTVTEISRNMVDFFFISNNDSRRNVPIISLSNDSKYIPQSENSSIQDTGHSVGYVLESLLGSFEYGFSLYPEISRYDEEAGITINLSELSFRVHKPNDRTIDNNEDNSPVVFSRSMNNLMSSVYTEDYTEHCSTAIVAGEGEGSERTTVEIGDSVASGLDRTELYVDARDIQSESDGRAMTEEEYTEALSNRGFSYLEDHSAFSSVTGTIIDGSSSYVYGRDFFLGDYVSVIDEDFGIIANVQITSVKKSLTESGEKIDLTFGKERSRIQKIIRKRGIV